MSSSRKYVLFLLFCLLSIFIFSGCSSKKKGSNILITVNQYVYHPNLDSVYKGFKEVVNEWANSNHKTVDYKLQNAQGDPSIATQIARQQVAENPDIIFALATPSAQASIKATSKIPIIFGAITDPVSAGLVNSLAMPAKNATGTSDIGPYEKQFELIRRLCPEAKIVGIIRNPGEVNSVASMKIIDKAISNFGFIKVEASVANTSEVLLAARSLIGRCDILYMPADNTVLSALDAIVSVAQTKKIPLFVGDEGSVEMGGVATIGINYYKLGQLTGKIAVKVLEGQSPSTIPVGVGEATQVVLNLKAAEKQGLKFPEDIIKSAKIVGK